MSGLAVALKPVTDALAAIEAAAFGEGQTWQDMTASRSLSTLYTNTSGRPIMVKIWESPSGYFAESNHGLAGEGPNRSLTYIVPNGSTYGQVSNQGAAFTFTKWMELR